jgi:cytochrome c oxidase subunit 2
MFYMGWRGYLKEIQIPGDALPVRVTAQMWKWTFEYPNGVKADTLYVPVNAAMKLTMHSLDVNHSLFIPAFRIKEDVIPNRENKMWFRTPRIASYDIACAEFCGLQHSYMYTKVVSLDTLRFEAWYRTASVKQSKPYTPLTAQTAAADSR